ncbi:MAG: Rne/Rng family ribonuclease [Roseobacter sp.]
MAKKMLIDATHAEETRVVVVDGNKVEEFDFESENRRQLAGNIYLAKVTRVEPSLQAAFIDYGGNRHGFLAFSEIHPDYYQIPVADRQALMEEERAYAEAQRAQEDEEEKPKKRSRTRSRSKNRAESVEDSDAKASRDVDADQIDGMETIDLDAEDEGLSPMERVAETPVEEPETVDAASENQASEGEVSAEDVSATDETVAQEPAPVAEDEGTSDDLSPKPRRRRSRGKPKSEADEAQGGDTTDSATGDATEDGDEDTPATDRKADPASKDDSIESVADDDDHEDIRPPRKPRPRRYKIQEVIKVRQILLVQVVKEERGNKGAALTTYLSLAGRYCVLMPNTARGGGISRKITNAVDRKKLKEIAGEIEVPQGAGLIVRTAGAKRTKAEIKRDYEYLQRLWEQIRELTLKSIAPSKIYEEGDLIKRSIRDLYNREIDEVFVEGERGYRIAKDFMKMIMPSHAKNVKLYTEGLPLFARYQVETYLAGMFNPTVQLPSGGYIVIGVTEALVAIDVNSGRATKEGSIEQTALKTNLEAADEVARQLRLRDLAGLIVIDFIDMDERKNNASVEKRMKDKLKTDRARIQVGRISGFGLMEMSRQRLRPGMIEATTQPCGACHGTGLIRSDDNLALSVLRQIEEEGTRKRSREVLIKAPVGIANFLMNQKREHIAQIEARYGLSVRIEGDPALVSPDFTMEKFKTATRTVPVVDEKIVSGSTLLMDAVDADEPDVVDEADNAPEAVPDEDDGEAKPKRRRRRRRRGRGRSGNGQDENTDQAQADGAAETAAPETDAQDVADTPVEAPAEGEAGGDAATDDAEAAAAPEPVVEDKPKPKRGRTRKRKVEDEGEAKSAEAEPGAEVAAPVADGDAEQSAAPAEKPKRTRRKKAPAKTEETAPVAPSDTPSEPEVVAEASAAAAVQPETTPEPEPEPEPVAAVAAPETVTETAADASTEVAAEVAEKPAEPAKPKRRGWWSLGG